MEWVETTARTLEDAKELALDQLGVDETDAEFEVLEEPKAGLFGRMRGEARVRARVRPTQARQKVDRRDKRRAKTADGAAATVPATNGDTAEPAERAPSRSRGGSRGRPRAGAAGDAAVATDVVDAPEGAEVSAPREARPPRQRTPKPRAPRDDADDTTSPTTTSTRNTSTRDTEHDVSAQEVGAEAQRFIDELVRTFGLQGTTSLVEDGDDLEVRVEGDNLGLLVGPRGTTLQAVQDLARVASQRRLGDHDTRLRIDIGGYRQRRKEALGRFALQQAAEVTASGVARVLEPMSSADRKVIHDALGEIEGISTRSEGDDPYRRVVIAPANG
jgi:spoIIIJ-associated protein